MAKSKKSASKSASKTASKSSGSKKSKPKKPSKSGSKKSKSAAPSKGPSPLAVGLGVAALAGVAYLVWPRSASAATIPARTTPVVSSRGTTPTPSPARTARTAAKPQMPSDLRSIVTAGGQLPFWILAAIYKLDSRAGAPTAAGVTQLIGGSFPSAAAQALSRLGYSVGSHGTEPSLDVVELLYGRVKGSRFDLPYQVPTDVWNYANVFLKDLFNEDDASFLEPT